MTKYETQIVEGRRRLVFIGASEDQQSVASDYCDKSITWREVSRFLDERSGQSPIVSEFCEFLRMYGLSIRSEVTMDDRLRSRAICNELRRKPWEHLPDRYRRTRNVTDRWGRVGVEFGQWIPVTEAGLLAGIVYAGGDHKIEVLDDSLALDLIFTIDVGNTGGRVPLGVVDEQTRLLVAAEPTLSVRCGYECRNRKQDLIIQEPLSKTLVGFSDPVSDANAVYMRFQRWCELLFSNGQLHAAMERVWPVPRSGRSQL